MPRTYLNPIDISHEKEDENVLRTYNGNTSTFIYMNGDIAHCECVYLRRKYLPAVLNIRTGLWHYTYV